MFRKRKGKVIEKNDQEKRKGTNAEKEKKTATNETEKKRIVLLYLGISIGASGFPKGGKKRNEQE